MVLTDAEKARRGQPRWATALGVSICLELAAVAWLALWPIVTVAPDVVSRALADPVSEALPALKALYGFGTSSLDVLALTLLRTQLLLALLFLVPASKRGQAADKDAGVVKDKAAADAVKDEGSKSTPHAVSRAEDDKPEDEEKRESFIHDKVLTAMSALKTISMIFLMAKIVYVALTAPEPQVLWPTLAAGGTSLDCGLYMTFGCTIVCLAGGVLVGYCAGNLVALRKTLFIDSGKTEEEREKDKTDAEDSAKDSAASVSVVNALVQLFLIALPDLPLLALGALTTLASGQLSTYSFVQQGKMVSYATTEPNLDLFVSTSLRVLTLLGLDLGINKVRDYVGGFIERRLSDRSARDLLRKLLFCDKAYFDKHPAAEVIDMLGANPGSLVYNLFDKSVSVVNCACILVSYTYVMWTTNWRMAGAGVLYVESQKAVTANSAKTDVAWAVASLFTWLNSKLQDMGILIQAGALVTFRQLWDRYSGNMHQIKYYSRSMLDDVNTARKAFALLRYQPKIKYESGKLTLPGGLAGGFEFRDVVFSYPSAPETIILQDLTLSIKPGQTVAFVGASGGGKSSIMRLIQRFYLPNSGTVMLDGHDLGEYDHRWLRKQMSIVSQEPVLFDRSIYRNIIFGLEEHDGETAPPSLEEVVEAAKQANAHDFIIGLDKGYATKAGTGGSKLSGGQKQRVAIARALVRKPRVLLLDEATSALDAESEGIVQEALDRSCKGRTTIIIAHRLATIKNADLIVVVGKGAPAVKEVGTYDQLVAKGGIFAGLVDKQKLGDIKFKSGSAKWNVATAGALSFAKRNRQESMSRLHEEQAEELQAKLVSAGVSAHVVF
ncbi:hypothetical protein HXX76_009208 [Chlamydomonas incerta]|uniref:Uncharacterized protein n=1 Tax=Chlamydomonas incerta TaxID=51695 RepID=A0A835SR71_CHLIN|nr:hypothetical protein HXX76_009208 [Chlamydomonas incerta]|eukprot:KAG2431709.1 hypothetical protein HXX76_009208 [Chlamydomonas incerta]